MDWSHIFTVESKERNPYSQYVKKIRLYRHSRKGDYAYLPSTPGVLWRKGLAPAPLLSPNKAFHNEMSAFSAMRYLGTMTEEQSHIFGRIQGRGIAKYWAGLIDMKTGRGKSHVIMRLAAETLQGNVAILCHSTKTAREMVANFKRFTEGEEVGLVGDGSKQYRRVTVMTHDSFSQHPWLEADAILYDEADYNLSSTMIGALCTVHEARGWGRVALYGFTGTPYRKDLDQNDMQLVFGEIIRDESQKQAYNMKPSVRVVKYELDEVPVFGAFNELKDALMADEGRMEAQREEIRKLMKEGRKAVLILSERVAECQTYAAWLKEDGIPHVLITGETKPVEDQASVDALLKAGIPFVIVGSVGKMSRGADVPAIDTVCLFSALQFRGTVVQAVGRSLRTFAGKLPPMIVDWNDLPILKSQASARRTSYRKEYGKDVSIDMVLPAIEELTEALPEVSLGEGLHNVGRGDSQEPQLALL